uniref:Nucleoporin n=1 Tax=Schistosoma japonicum TaxID=6182 RepID=C1LGU0_SCHJA|nr:Nucleoporin [Schistosoma japonicum]
MAKRRADIELNRDNWDDDLVSTAKGDFDKADKDVLSQRKILTARTNRNSTGTSGLFKSFTAFSNCSNGNPASLNFGFTPSVTKANGHKQDDSEYLEHLQTLNQNLLDWITKHIKEDPYCILSPIFSDYNKHLSEINSKFPEHSLVGSATVPEKKEPSGCLATNISKVTETSVTSVSNSVFIFGNSLSKPITVSSNASNDSTDKKPIFSFGLPPITTSSKFPQSIFHFSGVSNFQPNSDSKQSISINKRMMMMKNMFLPNQKLRILKRMGRSTQQDVNYSTKWILSGENVDLEIYSLNLRQMINSNYLFELTLILVIYC